LLLVEYNAANLHGAPPLDGFETLQAGSRYGDDAEMYVLYRKVEKQ
jgi:hypothetical protein